MTGPAGVDEALTEAPTILAAPEVVGRSGATYRQVLRAPNVGEIERVLAAVYPFAVAGEEDAGYVGHPDVTPDGVSTVYPGRAGG